MCIKFFEKYLLAVTASIPEIVALLVDQRLVVFAQLDHLQSDLFLLDFQALELFFPLEPLGLLLESLLLLDDLLLLLEPLLFFVVFSRLVVDEAPVSLDENPHRLEVVGRLVVEIDSDVVESPLVEEVVEDVGVVACVVVGFPDLQAALVLLKGVVRAVDLAL